jgi:hypothetical protein
VMCHPLSNSAQINKSDRNVLRNHAVHRSF